MAVGLARSRKWQGVNLSVDPQDLGDNELALSRNVHAEKKDGGTLILRRSSLFLHEWNTHQPPLGTAHLFRFRTAGTTWALGWEAPGRWFYYSPEVQQLIQFVNLPEGAPRKPCIIQWQDRAYLLTDGGPGYMLKRVAGASVPFTLTSMAGKWVLPSPAAVGTIYQGSLVLGGFGPAEESLVRWCEVGDPDTLLSDTKSINIGRGIGGEINGIIEVPIEGGAEPVQTYGIFLKPGGMWMAQGAPPTSTDDGDIKITPLNQEQGLISKETIAVTAKGVIWSSGGNVWLAAVGAKPVAIGDAIAPMLEVTPQYRDQWHAVYHDGFYRLTIPAPQANTGAYAQVEQWWCDLRDFPRVSWWGPMEVSTAAAVSLGDPGGAAQLLAWAHRSNGVGSSTPYSLDLEQHDVPTYRRLDHYGAPSGQLRSPVLEVQGRLFDFGDPETKKIIQGVELNVQIDMPHDVTVELRGDGGEANAEETQLSENGGYILETGSANDGVLDTGKLTNGYKSINFTPPEGRRYLAYTVQPVVRMSGLNGDEGGGIRIRDIVLKVRSISRRPSTIKSG